MEYYHVCCRSPHGERGQKLPNDKMYCSNCLVAPPTGSVDRNHQPESALREGFCRSPHGERGQKYDDRLLVKPTKSAIAYMTDPVYEAPYEGAKEMLLVDEVDQKEFLTGLFHAMYEELPMPKQKRKNKYCGGEKE